MLRGKDGKLSLVDDLGVLGTTLVILFFNVVFNVANDVGIAFNVFESEVVKLAQASFTSRTVSGSRGRRHVTDGFAFGPNPIVAGSMQFLPFLTPQVSCEILSLSQGVFSVRHLGYGVSNGSFEIRSESFLGCLGVENERTYPALVFEFLLLFGATDVESADRRLADHRIK